MTYATLDHLIERFGERMLVQLTDRGSPATGEVDGDVVAAQLANADAVIDGFLLGRYALPLADTPPLLVDLAQAIAIYKLHPFDTDEKIRRDYADALATLDRIAAGKVRLPVAGVEPPSSGASGVQAIDRERDMTPENLRGFI